MNSLKELYHSRDRDNRLLADMIAQSLIFEKMEIIMKNYPHVANYEIIKRDNSLWVQDEHYNTIPVSSDCLSVTRFNLNKKEQYVYRIMEIADFNDKNVYDTLLEMI